MLIERFFNEKDIKLIFVNLKMYLLVNREKKYMVSKKEHPTSFIVELRDF